MHRALLPPSVHPCLSKVPLGPKSVRLLASSLPTAGPVKSLLQPLLIRVLLLCQTSPGACFGALPLAPVALTRSPSTGFLSLQNHRQHTVMAEHSNQLDGAASEGQTRVGYCLVPSDYLKDVPESWTVKQYTLVIPHREGVVLLGMKKRGFGEGKWNGFGGKIELKETIPEGALRELEEECCVSARMEDLKKRAIFTFIFQGNPKVLPYPTSGPSLWWCKSFHLELIDTKCYPIHVSMQIMQVHFFSTDMSKLEGTAKETEEMRPQEFSVDSIPFESMWPDDTHWFPKFLNGDDFEGAFLYKNETEIIQHSFLPKRWPGVSEPGPVPTWHNLAELVPGDIHTWRERNLKEDYNTVIAGERVLLVPYRREHVDRYHEWMQDEEILKFTGSEPQTLEEEIEMQKKWETEYDKATFIVLHRDSKQMFGDVNLFFYEDDPCHAEINVMVAEKSFRRQGYATEIMKLMMHYGYRRLLARQFAAKIDKDNLPSIALFKSLHFEEVKYCNVFKQHELLWKPDASEIASSLLDSSMTEEYGSKHGKPNHS